MFQLRKKKIKGLCDNTMGIIEIPNQMAVSALNYDSKLTLELFRDIFKYIESEVQIDSFEVSGVFALRIIWPKLFLMPLLLSLLFFNFL